MKIILTRHGKTKENIAGIIMGHAPGHLSTTGIKQAKVLSNIVSKKLIDFIYASDLKRCVDTAKILNERLHKKITLDKRLREIDYGKIQEYSPDSSVRNMDYLSDLDIHFPDGESNNELIKRVVDCINEILKEHRNETILIVTHSGPIAVIRASITGITYRKAIEEKSNFTEIEEYTISDYIPYPS